MIAATVGQIAKATAARQVFGREDATATSVTIDSRRSQAGACFFAIVGERHDGHDFVDAAVRAGASVIVVHQPLESPFGDGDVAVIEVNDTTLALQSLASWLRRLLDPEVVAITGSLGKTTTKELAAALLGERFDTHASPGNLNNHWGLPLSLLGLEPHHEVMVAELAMSAAGEIRALARLAAPDIGVITNVAPAHMENFADLDAVADAKGELAEELGSSATLVVNADDPRTEAIARAHTGRVSRVVRFGLHEDADVRASDVAPVDGGWSFSLWLEGRVHRVDLRLPGAAGIPCFLAATAAASVLGVEGLRIAEQAPSLRLLENRGGTRRIHGLTLLDESYNSSPVAAKAALDRLAGIGTDSRRVAVLGDMLEMGSWTERVHRDVGAHAAEIGADLLVGVGSFASFVADGAIAAGMNATSVHTFPTATAAAEWLPPRLRRGDAILVKGSRAVHLEHVVDAVAVALAASNDLVGN